MSWLVGRSSLGAQGSGLYLQVRHPVLDLGPDALLRLAIMEYEVSTGVSFAKPEVNRRTMKAYQVAGIQATHGSQPRQSFISLVIVITPPAVLG